MGSNRVGTSTNCLGSLLPPMNATLKNLKLSYYPKIIRGGEYYIKVLKKKKLRAVHV